jgi:uncharacterized protein
MKKMQIYILLGIGVVLLLGVMAYLQNFGRPFQYKKDTVELRGHRFEVEIADTIPTRARGLSYRESLPEDAGMLFIFSSSSKYGFWMKDMKFPIDIIWLKGDTVVGIAKNAQPEPEKTVYGLTKHFPPEEIDRVLEINAGLSDKYGIVPGDKATLRLVK